MRLRLPAAKSSLFLLMIVQACSSNSETADWKTYTSSSFDFSIAHPPNATVGTEAGHRVKFQVTHPDQPEGTEVIDGFTFTVSVDPNPAHRSLREWAQENIRDERQVGSVVEGISDTTFQGRPALKYRTENLGEIQHLVFPHTDERIVHLSWNIAKTRGVERDYREIIQSMLRSFKLVQESSAQQEVRIAVLDPTEDGSGKRRGCDRVVYLQREIPAAVNPVRGAVEELFSLESTNPEGHINFIARTKDTLSLERVEVESGVARVYLTGKVTGLRGVCDNPRAAIQIEETARRAPRIDSVELYLNGMRTDLIPGERGLE